MAIGIQVSPAEYLKTSFDDLDKEYVGGNIVDRSMPTRTHAAVQAFLIIWLTQTTRTAGVGLRVYPELRLQLASDVFLIPDVCAYSEDPGKEVPDAPPLVAIEILSDEDLHSRMIEKLQAYQGFGVPNIWIVDPQLRQLSIYDGSLRRIDALQVPTASASLTIDNIMAEL